MHQTARLLSNKEALPSAQIRQKFQGQLAAISRQRAAAGRLQPAVEHFLKVTRSYWPGLFACSEVSDLPATNNDLEQFFGSHRHHERRATGRKVASSMLVLRGPARIIAAAATRSRQFSGVDLAPTDPTLWRELRSSFKAREGQRVLRYRFRRNPAGYLNALEAQLAKSTLPP